MLCEVILLSISQCGLHNDPLASTVDRESPTLDLHDRLLNMPLLAISLLMVFSADQHFIGQGSLVALYFKLERSHGCCCDLDDSHIFLDANLFEDGAEVC